MSDCMLKEYLVFIQ